MTNKEKTIIIDVYMTYPSTTDYKTIPSFPRLICPICGDKLDIIVGKDDKRNNTFKARADYIS